MSSCCEEAEAPVTAALEGDLRLALVGNPNCGKTALFNALTGARQKVANYPGVTVERKQGRFATPAGRRVNLIDLPGTYSLRARSPDEVVTRDAVLGRLKGEQIPDMLLCVADSTNLRIALRLVLELRKVGRPMILALNMFDIARHRGWKIDVERLSEELGIPVVTSVAVRSSGTGELLAALDALAANPPPVQPSTWEERGGDTIRALQRRADALIAACVTPPVQPDTVSRRIDKVVLHPVFGVILLLVILFVMFQAVFTWAQPPMDAITNGFTWLGGEVGEWLPEGLLRSFVSDGVISGVGAVVTFMPQILVLFFFILLLEDSGYMARAAFLMDRVMGGAGLHGRAFIPLLSSFACAIPGIMSARVIDSRRDRLATIMVAPLMTCSARIPVYALLIAAFVPNRAVWGGIQLQGLVMFSLYVAGIASALLIAWVLKHLVWRNSPTEPFMLELPDYKLPSVKNIVFGLYHRASAFLTRAGTIILSMMMVIWFLASFPQAPENATQPAIDYSFAARIGHFIEPVTAPVGFNWQINVALLPGMAAREVAVASLGTVYAVAASDDDTSQLGDTLAHSWSLATALALLVWYVFAPQCASTLATVKRETGSWTWMAGMFAYMMVLAYLGAFATYHAAVALGWG